MPSELQKKWGDRITRAKKEREEWDKEFKTAMQRAYFEGKQNPGYPQEEWITLNKIYSHLMAQLPMLYSMDPYFYVKLKKSFSIDPADIAKWEAMGRTRQAMLNYLKGELDLKGHARLAILDAHFEFGVIKTRRASDEEDHPHAGEPVLSDEGKELTDETTGEPLLYPKTRPVNERYELDRVHPKDMLFGCDSGPMEKTWDWIGQKLVMSKEEALADRRFKKRTIQAIKGKSKDAADEKKPGVLESFLSRAKPNDEVFIEMYEIYDLKANEWLIWADGAEDLVIDAKSVPAGIDKHPYSFLRFTLRDASPYPIPPVFNMLDPQREYNLSRSRILTHRKRFNRKYEVDVNKLEDPDGEITKLENGDDGTIVRVMAPGAVTPIQDAPLDQQTYTEIAMLNNDLVEISGTPDNARSIASADSATEASLLDKRLEVREGDRMGMVVEFVTDIARKLDQLVQAHIDRDEAVKITGPQGESWQTIKQDDYKQINGEYEYSVNTGASQPRLPEIERAQWIAFLSQVVIPMPQILTAPSVMRRMAEMFHIEDEAALEELRQLGLKMMSGAMPMPGGQGGGPSDNPVAAILGAAMGAQGGNNNGGGSPMIHGAGPGSMQ
jgi:hypothetical protein